MYRFLFAALVLTGAVFAGDPPKIDPEVKAKPGRMLKLNASSPTPVRWINTNDAADLIPDSNGKTAIFFPTVPGRYKIAVYTSDATGPSEPAYCVVVVEGDTPPKPEPKPDPKPDPDVKPAPTPGKLKAALIVYESAELSKLPAARQSILYAAPVREYLNKVTPTSADGKTKEWRIFDKDVDLSNAPEVYKKLMTKSRDSLPWIYIDDGGSGYSGPLPDDTDKTLELLKKYGG